MLSGQRIIVHLAKQTKTLDALEVADEHSIHNRITLGKEKNYD
jgi:hypothetical protein